MKRLMILFVSALVLTSCNKKKNDGDSDFDSTAFVGESAAGAINQAASSSEGGSSASGSQLTSSSLIAQAPGTGSCPNALYPTVACGGDQSNVSLIKYDSNGDGSGSACNFAGFLLYGTQSLTFDSAQTCQNFNPLVNWPAQGSQLTRKVNNFRRQSVVYGHQVLVSTDAVPDFSGAAHGGGVTATFGSLRGDRSVMVHGVNRKLIGRFGRTLFDHSIYTDSPVQITGTLAGGDRTVNGVVQVAHNLARYKAAVNLQNVRWNSPACCHPTSGRIVSQLSGSVSGQVVLEYSAQCGEAQLTDVNGQTSRVTLNSCE